ncbi:bifunctional phosphopantothenoylcysteine decarboxylase/phosphopantothenate--cysteine ligase CoaBC [Porticoccaceae bacterium]|nr:bifunctional phosphopantothenoylcysteine decarboxylase/phosphopantothenate--cysteine ligase CoaBC [Porticoccaceae bacterium]MDB9949416.1 bifunctional phosphopantothenoylcysteine decarboxylase/phosphopantothenate--cysteine ligase CoaBC [Porticoccaceae bacterium]
MSTLSNKRIIVGVNGGIAAYKSAEVVRRLQDAGAEVRVVMTPGAEEFIRPLTLQALSGHPVHADLLDPEAEAGMGHIELARWADLVLIAPATADFIATMVHGRANSLLNAIYLATPAIVAVAPAMNQGMWSHPATTANMEQLSQRQVKVFGPDSGIQACGDIGPGRMQQPDILVEQVGACFASMQLSGKKLVITAGPTREAIDPVRYISNHSSGKMGYALAEAAIEAGAEVTLISGPVNLEPPQRCTVIPVISAADMHRATMSACADANILIASAAVADYRPVTVATQKMKKHADAMTLELEKNVDIVSAAASEYENLFVVGFAAETQDVESYARGKLECKGLDAIVANDVSRSDVGFNSDNNEAWWISADTSKTFSIRSKTQLARDIVAAIAEQLG